MPPKTTDTNEAPVIPENPGALESEAKAAAEKAKAEADGKAAADKLQADAEEAARKAEEERSLDISVESLMQLLEDFFNVVDAQDALLQDRLKNAEDTLAEALYAQNQINRIVDERTKALDELIIEKAGSPDNNPMTEIQFYLTSQQRKREQKAEQRKQMLDQGIDTAELIKRLDGRSPIDQRQPARKKNPASLKAVKTAAA